MSGTNAVSYLLKCMGKETISNDYMNMNYLAARCLIENSTIRLEKSFVEALIRKIKHRILLQKNLRDYISTKVILK